MYDIGFDHINEILLRNYKVTIYVFYRNKQFIIIHKPSLETIKNTDYELYKLINKYIFSKELVDNDIMLKENYIENLKSKYENIRNLLL